MAHFWKKPAELGKHACLGLLLAALALCVACDNSPRFAEKDKPQLGGDIPKDWPSDIATYTGAKVYAVQPDRLGTNLILKTPDSIKQCMDFYKDKLKSDGWTVTRGPIKLGEGQVLQLSKGTRRLTVSIEADAEPGSKNTKIELNVPKEQ